MRNQPIQCNIEILFIINFFSLNTFVEKFKFFTSIKCRKTETRVAAHKYRR